MATLTVYPDAGSGATTVVGAAQRDVPGAPESFTTIRAGAGSSADTTYIDGSLAALYASATSNLFSFLVRSIETFDTSPIGLGSRIFSATLSVHGTASSDNDLGSPTIDLLSSTPAVDDNVEAADFTQIGTTVFASIAYASWNTSAYNDFALNANGLANISKTGISRFGFRLGWDTANNFTGIWVSSVFTRVNGYAANQAGTTQDPKLVIVYTPLSNRILLLGVGES